MDQRQRSVESLVMFGDFYRGKRVLVTGHTGFKGAWLSLWLHRCGAEVHGFSLPAPTQPSFHEVLPPTTFASETLKDVRDAAAVAEVVRRTRPEVVFHLAAQPLVRVSYAMPVETLEVNTLGVARVLEAIRLAEVACTTLVITSDKCYENREWEFAYRENDPMGGHDVYSMSKGAAELVVQAWNRSFFLPNPKLGPVATVRAGNVIGGGDYAADRLVPDCVRSLLAGKPILIRNPGAVRPWQHVLECLSGYLWLAARLSQDGKLSKLATPFNFGPEPSSRRPVKELVQQVLRHWPGEWVDGSDPRQPHEATLLALSIEKAGALLAWHPAWTFSETVQRTVTWYYERHVARRASMLELSVEQIEAYTASARAQGLCWTQKSL